MPCCFDAVVGGSSSCRRCSTCANLLDCSSFWLLQGLLLSWHQMAMAARPSLLTVLCATTRRLKSSENAGKSASSSAQGHHQTKAVSHESQTHTLGTPLSYPTPTPLPVAPQVAAPASAPQPFLQGSTRQPSPQGSDQQPHRSSSTEQSSSTLPVCRAGSTPVTVQLVLDVSESSCSVHAVLSPAAEIAAEGVRQSDVKESHAENSAAASSLQAHGQQSAESGSYAATGQHALGSEPECPSLTELQSLLMEEKKRTAALIGKTLLCRRTMSSRCSFCTSPSPKPSPLGQFVRLP